MNVSVIGPNESSLETETRPGISFKWWNENVPQILYPQNMNTTSFIHMYTILMTHKFITLLSFSKLTVMDCKILSSGPACFELLY